MSGEVLSRLRYAFSFPFHRRTARRRHISLQKVLIDACPTGGWGKPSGLGASDSGRPPTAASERRRLELFCVFFAIKPDCRRFALVVKFYRPTVGRQSACPQRRRMSVAAAVTAAGPAAFGFLKPDFLLLNCSNFAVVCNANSAGCRSFVTPNVQTCFPQQRSTPLSGVRWRNSFKSLKNEMIAPHTAKG
jgi:hypothetical protein